MSIYLDKLAHIHVVINCLYSVAQMCTREDTLAQYLGALYLDEVMSVVTLLSRDRLITVFDESLLTY